MSNEKFTPGPWNVFDNGLIFVQPPPDSGTLVIAGCGTSFIGDGGEQAQWQIDRNRANGALIAAAPEMYEALAEFEETEKSDSTNSACSALDTVNVAYFVNFSRFYTIEDFK